jgi:hypothetical protein
VRSSTIFFAISKCTTPRIPGNPSQKRQQELNPYVDGMTVQVAQQQRDKYVNFIQMLLRNKQYITDIHFWSVSDKSVSVRLYARGTYTSRHGAL